MLGMSLDECLPAELRGSATAISKIAAGMSGAGVYRVETASRAYVLKVAPADEPTPEWQRSVAVARSAAGAGVAPAIVHVDEVRRAVVSELVVDRGFGPLYFDPRSRTRAIEMLGATLRRVHDLPLPPPVEAPTGREMLERFWDGRGPVPAFAEQAVVRVLAEAVPPAGPDVLSHNDVNPTNVVFDGERLVFFDWDRAGPNDRYYDLATAAVFLRMDDAECRALIGAHDGAAVDELPPRFLHDRRFVAAMCGAVFLRIARSLGHAGATDTVPPTLAEVYQRLRAGDLTIATADGQWQFGCALLATSLAL